MIREVLDKLPDEHAIRAIRLDDELERGLADGDPAGAGPPADDDAAGLRRLAAEPRDRRRDWALGHAARPASLPRYPAPL